MSWPRLPAVTWMNAVDFAVPGYAITSMETETYRPSSLILLGEDATPGCGARRSPKNPGDMQVPWR